VILTKDYWGHGLGTEIAGALRELAAELHPGKRVTAKIHPKNTGSLVVARRLGLTEDGTTLSHPYESWIHFSSPSATPTI
jgi:RimJ/RimL family protein N-acetyltransferase